MTSPSIAPHRTKARDFSDQQLGATFYAEKYMTLPWILSSWTQAKQVSRCGGKKVMEIGIGPGQTMFFLKQWGHRVIGVDLDPTLRPAIVSDLLHLPFADGVVDTVLAAEVLEHMPFDLFVPALRSLRRVTNKNVVITLPYRMVGVSLGINVPLLEPFFAAIGVPYRVANVYDGMHHWEMGRKGFSRCTIRRKIDEAGFSIVREFRIPLNLFSYGFVLQRV
jgi:ubiquinone/menaquinone biosynthesis C-methylase UbiE